ARGRLLGQVVLDDVDPVLVEEGDRLPAGGSARLEIELAFHFFRTHHVAALAAGAAEASGRWMASSSSICWMSAVQLPPQWPVVAVVQAATCVMVHAPLRMARSMVRYLMLLQRQTVFRPRIAGCSSCSWPSSIVREPNTAARRPLPPRRRSPSSGTPRPCSDAGP